MPKLENEQSNYKINDEVINDIFSGLDFKTHTITVDDFLDGAKDGNKEGDK